MAFNYNDNQKETGVDVTLDIAGYSGEVPVTSASFSEEADTSEVQFNNSYSKNIAVTGVTYSGSFETAGRDHSLVDALWNNQADNDDLSTTNPIHVSSMTFTDGGGRSYTFTNVVVTSHSKDMPADDRSTSSFDFSAEKLAISDS